MSFHKSIPPLKVVNHHLYLASHIIRGLLRATIVNYNKIMINRII